MFKITLADGTIVWVDGTYRQEVDEVIAGCNVKAIEEQELSMHAPSDAELFDLSGTQNDFKGKQRLRFCALESCIRALNQQLAESVPRIAVNGLNSDFEKLVKALSSPTALELSTAERWNAAACVHSLLCIQQALNNNPEWRTELLDSVAEHVRSAGLVLLDSDDSALSLEELEEKYSPAGGGQHPLFTRQDWRQKVTDEDTLLGYWAWVHHKLNED